MVIATALIQNWFLRVSYPIRETCFMPKKRTERLLTGIPEKGIENSVPEWKIENVVATAEVEFDAPGDRIELNQIAFTYTDCDYNPERFPGLCMRVQDPKATILIFSTGKMVITGLRQASDADIIINNVMKKMKKARVRVKNEPKITIQNIVASGDLHVSIDLDKAFLIMENTMYEPEVFPGLIYRMQEPKVVFLIFRTGRLVCTGGKTKEIVGEAVLKLAEQIKNHELIRGIK